MALKYADSCPSLSFSDQYAFRPTGSTTAAIISVFYKLTSLLQSNPFVFVISLDFSKAFDTVRYSSLLTKMAELDLPAAVYNWLVAFFARHDDEMSPTTSISASIIQGSSLGPASYASTLSRSTPTTALSSSQTTRTLSSRLSAPTLAPQNSTTLQRGQPRITCSWTSSRWGKSSAMTAAGVTVSSYRRCCRTSPATLRWKSSASSSAATCRHLTTSAMLSVTVHSRCTLCVSCITMAWTISACILSSGQSWCPGWCMHRPLHNRDRCPTNRGVSATLQALQLLSAWSARLWRAAGRVWRPAVPQDFEQSSSHTACTPPIAVRNIASLSPQKMHTRQTTACTLWTPTS